MASTVGRQYMYLGTVGFLWNFLLHRVGTGSVSVHRVLIKSLLWVRKQEAPRYSKPERF